MNHSYMFFSGSPSSPVSVVADLGRGVGGGDEQVNHARLQLLQTFTEQKQRNETRSHYSRSHHRHTHLADPSYLTHFRDRVVKDPPCVVGPLPHQFDLPGSGGKSEVGGVQLHDLPSDLHEDRLALPAAAPRNRGKRKENEFLSWTLTEMNPKFVQKSVKLLQIKQSPAFIYSVYRDFGSVWASWVRCFSELLMNSNWILR